MPKGNNKDRARSLQCEHWLRVGIRILSEGGHESLKLSRLATEAGLTTGSFYWHFRNFDEYQRRLVCFWVDVFLPEMAEKALKTAAPEQRLSKLLSVVKEEGHQLDAAMRKWGESNAFVEKKRRKANVYRRDALKEAAFHQLSESQLATYHMAFKGSVDMKDQDLRFDLLERILEEPREAASEVRVSAGPQRAEPRV